MYFWLILGLLFLMIIYLYIQNNLISISAYQVRIPRTHPSMKGKKIVFLSDTHIRDNTPHTMIDRLVIQIEDLQPDVILFGGDIVHVTDHEAAIEYAKDLFSQLAKVAPVYLVYGNHDMGNLQVQELTQVLQIAGVTLLRNEAEWVSFKEPGAGFWLMGLCEHRNILVNQQAPLEKIQLPKDSRKEPKILLAHFPHFFDQYLADEKKRPNLVLSGHTHGGQAIVPILGGLFSPGQGVNPKYDFGLFTHEKYPNSRLIVSRGIGNSTFPLRFNNRPEIVTITFE